MLVGIGSYLLREGDLMKFILFLLRKGPFILDIQFFYLISGIILNVFAIYFWQLSAKSDLPYSFAISLYLSMSMIVGIITSSIIEKTQLGFNIYVGTFLIILGIVVLTKSS